MTADIRINLRGPRTPVDRKIFGHFIEHMGRCIYGGVMRRSGSGWEIDRSFMETLKPLRVPVVRYPGGLFADVYHWEDGIGPLSSRPRRRNGYWSFLGSSFGPPEPNVFGTDEYLNWCREIGTEPYLNINYATGTPEEAARWVDYVNGPASSAGGSRRARNGHPDPYGVKIWGIGNETYAFWARGHTTPERYARRYLKFARAMKAVDPSLRFVMVGAFGDPLDYPRWNDTVLKIAGDEADWLSVHIYVPTDIPSLLTAGLKDTERNYLTVAASPLHIERKLRRTWAGIRRAAGNGTRIRIAFDEWNVLYSFFRDHGGRPWNLRDAVFAGGFLNALIRCSPFVTMANYAQLANVLGLTMIRDGRIVKTSHYHVFSMFAGNAGPETVPVDVTCGTFTSPALGIVPEMKGVPLLDCAATVDGGRTVLFVVNRSAREPVRADIRLDGADAAGPVEVLELSGNNRKVCNTFREPDRLAVVARQVPPLAAGGVLQHSFPPHSVSAVVLKTIPQPSAG